MLTSIAAVDGAVLQLTDERFRLYTVVDPETNRLLYVTLFTMKNQAITRLCSPNSPRSISLILHRSCKRRSTDMASLIDIKNVVIGTVLHASFETKTTNKPVLKRFQPRQSRCRGNTLYIFEQFFQLPEPSFLSDPDHLSCTIFQRFSVESAVPNPITPSGHFQ